MEGGNKHCWCLKLTLVGALSSPAQKVITSSQGASFCECCFVHFDDAFVQWTFHDGAPSRFLCGYPVPRGGGLEFQHSRCKRCAARYPHGRLLWDFVRRAVRRRTIAMYWNSLAHTPNSPLRIKYRPLRINYRPPTDKPHPYSTDKLPLRPVLYQ